MLGTALLLTILEKSFEKWAENEGTTAITSVANSIGTWSWESISHFGAKNAARSRFSKKLKGYSKLLVVRLEQEEKAYADLPGKLFYSPRIATNGGSYPRLALVPRFAVNKVAFSILAKDLSDAALLQDVDKEYFFGSIVSEFDNGLFVEKDPSVSRPIQTYSDRKIISKDLDSKWQRSGGFQSEYPGYFIVSDGKVDSRDERTKHEKKLEEWQGEMAAWSETQWNAAAAADFKV